MEWEKNPPSSDGCWEAFLEILRNRGATEHRPEPRWNHKILTKIIQWLVPSGKVTVCDIENGPVEIGDLPIYKIVIFHSFLYVYQRVNLHFPIVFLWFSHFPMVFPWFSNQLWVNVPTWRSPRWSCQVVVTCNDHLAGWCPRKRRFKMWGIEGWWCNSGHIPNPWILDGYFNLFWYQWEYRFSPARNFIFFGRVPEIGNVDSKSPGSSYFITVANIA